MLLPRRRRLAGAERGSRGLQLIVGMSKKHARDAAKAELAAE